MIYGISTHPFAYEKLSGEHLNLIADSGFDTIEIFANRMQVDFDDASQLIEIAKAVNNNNFFVNSVHAPFYFSLEGLRSGIFVDIASDDENLRTKSVEEIKASFSLASMFDVDYYIMHFPYKVNRDSMLKSLEELFKFAEHLQIKLCFENIPGRETSVRHIVEFIEKEMVPVGIGFDIGHSNLNGEVYSDIENYGVYFYSSHIHDNFGDRDSHLLPFEGNINWDKVFELFKKVDYKWGMMLEVRMADRDSYKSLLKKAFKVTKKFKKLEKKYF
ncbi:conserved hypothetical protein [Thermotomaculum hydrothermale]|uniref:Xylose isomerase-like TIM barrel domain-containing protein n=1 Tax=Thermotomaculum hydrothermale TaxID=981385 RepID=A0A7R6SZ88_9BACT|nr:sugar phosphate isomerase/epimerase family protein [Thermotomaculum hydrothermale]BBB32565.1 conserved hypothetical protein [Thermotomaculum hydrothermale]